MSSWGTYCRDGYVRFTEARKRVFLQAYHVILMEFLQNLAMKPFVLCRLSLNPGCCAPDMFPHGEEGYTFELLRGIVTCYQCYHDCGEYPVLLEKMVAMNLNSFLSTFVVVTGVLKIISLTLSFSCSSPTRSVVERTFLTWCSWRPLWLVPEMCDMLLWNFR